MAGLDEFKEVSENLPNPLIDAGVVGVAFYLWVEEVSLSWVFQPFGPVRENCKNSILNTPAIYVPPVKKTSFFFSRMFRSGAHTREANEAPAKPRNVYYDVQRINPVVAQRWSTFARGGAGGLGRARTLDLRPLHVFEWCDILTLGAALSAGVLLTTARHSLLPGSSFVQQQYIPATAADVP